MNQALANKAREWARDLRRFQLQEETQGHVSPTDAALLNRLQGFLLNEVAPALDEAKTAEDGRGGNGQHRA